MSFLLIAIIRAVPALAFAVRDLRRLILLKTTAYVTLLVTSITISKQMRLLSVVSANLRSLTVSLHLAKLFAKAMLCYPTLRKKVKLRSMACFTLTTRQQYIWAKIAQQEEVDLPSVKQTSSTSLQQISVMPRLQTENDYLY